MDLDVFDQLCSPAGSAALAAAAALGPTEPTFLANYERLRKQVSADLAKAALETCILREKAAAKFTRAAEMYFTREALEQASGEVIARYRADRFRRFGVVGDFCCGVGGDAIGLASTGFRVVALDRDPLRLRMAERNLAAYALADRVTFVNTDVLTDPLPDVAAVFADPARRSDGRRFVSLADYGPPPRDLLRRLPAGFPVAFKLAPAVPWDEIEPFGGEAEFVSVGGELKECVLWLGPLATVPRRATVLPSADTLSGDPAPALPVGGPRRFLYDPDPAVTRAGLVTNLGARLGATMIDPTIAFLTADVWQPTPFATGYEIEVTMPFHARRLGEALRVRGVGRVTVVKRGSAVVVEELVRKWKLSGPEHRVVILTRVGGKPFALIGSERRRG